MGGRFFAGYSQASSFYRHETGSRHLSSGRRWRCTHHEISSESYSSEPYSNGPSGVIRTLGDEVAVQSSRFILIFFDPNDEIG